MNPTEIYDALSELAAKPFNATEFPFEFALATDAAQAAVAKLRNGSTNKSDLPGGVLFNKKFHFAPALGGLVEVTLDLLKASRRNATAKPAILVATDGETVAAHHPASGDSLHCKFAEIGDHFGFFLPAAGKERYKAAEENPLDIKATGKLARLYDALTKANPDWATDARRHEMSQLMMRLIFCLFAEDVGIFPENQFSKAIFTHAGDKGEEARDVLIAAFRAMNLRKEKRQGLPAWTHVFEYVNGGLFAGEADAPHFDTISFRYLKEAASLNWREINPDIFGSMIQSVADPKQRAELGMHYTSVPNIMKVIGPLFLDDIDAEIAKAWDKPKALHKLLARLENIRVFDPACGSGNFLVVAYRQLREREMRILKRLEELEGAASLRMFSAIAIKNFYGIEITDFGVETAKLALFIAEYQANAVFAATFGRKLAALPLKDGANIVHGNALRLNWEDICPPPIGEVEVFIVGNPPYLGKGKLSAEQKSDMEFVFNSHDIKHGYIDYVGGWFLKAAQYAENRKAASAMVATNSIGQGRQAPALWPLVLSYGSKISFVHTSFRWKNNASNKATVVCVVVGLSTNPNQSRRIFTGGTVTNVKNITPYFTDGENIFVHPSGSHLWGILPPMSLGNKANDDGNLIFTKEEYLDCIQRYPESAKFFKKYLGSKELNNGIDRYCIWIPDYLLDEARTFDEFRRRIDANAEFRSRSTDAGNRALSKRPHQMREMKSTSSTSVFVSIMTSQKRNYFPSGVIGPDTIISGQAFAIYDTEIWPLSISASRLHFSWASTICGQLKEDYRYSNDLGWNTFPVPKFTDEQLTALTASARKILKTRYEHYPKTIADLYDPDNMPDDLREVHRENDELLESMYIGRPFRNDTERLEHLFKLYAAKIKSMEKKG